MRAPSGPIGTASTWLLLAVVAGVAAATSIPALYAAFDVDLFASLGRAPGIGDRKWAAYLWLFGAGGAVSIALLILLRKPRAWWGAVLGVFAACVTVTASAHRLTHAEVYDGFYGSRSKALYLPQVPSLGRLFADTSWRSDVSSFASFAELAEDRHAWLRRDLTNAGLSEEEARVASAMLFVSSLWAFGNAEAVDQPGCVLGNEDNGWVQPSPITARTYSEAAIGCCTDYAQVLKSILDRAGYENRLVVSASHIFNEVRIGSRWWVVDANVNLMVDRAWEAIGPETEARVFLFAHPSAHPGDRYRPLLPRFQKMRLNSVLRGRPGPADYPAQPGYFLSAEGPGDPLGP